MLALERLEVDAARGRLGRAPDRAAGNDEAAEIFKETAELRVAGAVGDGAVEGEVLVDGVVAALDRRLDRLIALDDLLDLRRRCALGAQTGGLGLDAGAQLHDVEHLAQRRALVEIDPERPPHPVGDEGADALSREHQTVRTQRGHRFTDHGAADAGGRDHLLLGRQTRARRQLAAGDVGRKPRHQFGRQAPRGTERTQQLEIFRGSLGQRLDTGLGGQVII